MNMNKKLESNSPTLSEHTASEDVAEIVKLRKEQLNAYEFGKKVYSGSKVNDFFNKIEQANKKISFISKSKEVILAIVDLSPTNDLDKWIIITEDNLYSQFDKQFIELESLSIHSYEITNTETPEIIINDQVINKFVPKFLWNTLIQPDIKDVSTLFELFFNFIDAKKDEIKRIQIEKQKEEDEKNILLAEQLTMPHIAVIATMSAGKSTFLNALLGDEYLHSANQATTAKLTYLVHPEKKRTLSSTLNDLFNKKELNFEATAHFDENKSERIDKIAAENLKNWNSDDQIKEIKLIGQIDSAPKYSIGVTFIDTPGPNNSQDDTHRSILEDFIDKPYLYTHIFYVLNATQLAINDDKFLLNRIAESLSREPKRKIIFILNKVDALDEDKGEKVSLIVQKTKQYLEENGFVDPMIIPFAAQTALLCKKALSNQSLSRSERGFLLREIENAKLEDWMHCSTLQNNVVETAINNRNKQKGKKEIVIGDQKATQKTLKQLAQTSGLGLAEVVIENEITLFKEKQIAKLKALTEQNKIK